MPRMVVSLLALALVSTISFAQTCPDVKAIRDNKIAGWLAYDMYGKVLSAADQAKFRTRALEFALAEVTPHAKTLSIRCLYRDKSGSNLEAYLAKDNIVADNAKNYWYDVSGSTHCAAGVDNCTFNVNAMKPTQFAKK